MCRRWQKVMFDRPTKQQTLQGQIGNEKAQGHANAPGLKDDPARNRVARPSTTSSTWAGTAGNLQALTNLS